MWINISFNFKSCSLTCMQNESLVGVLILVLSIHVALQGGVGGASDGTVGAVLVPRPAQLVPAVPNEMPFQILGLREHLAADAAEETGGVAARVVLAADQMLVERVHLAAVLTTELADGDLGVVLQKDVKVVGVVEQLRLDGVPVIVVEVVGQAAEVSHVAPPAVRAREDHVRELHVGVHLDEVLVGLHHGEAGGAVAVRVVPGEGEEPVARVLLGHVVLEILQRGECVLADRAEEQRHGAVPDGLLEDPGRTLFARRQQQLQALERQFVHVVHDGDHASDLARRRRFFHFQLDRILSRRRRLILLFLGAVLSKELVVDGRVEDLDQPCLGDLDVVGGDGVGLLPLRVEARVHQLVPALPESGFDVLVVVVGVEEVVVVVHVLLHHEQLGLLVRRGVLHDALVVPLVVLVIGLVDVDDLGVELVRVLVVGDVLLLAVAHPCLLRAHLVRVLLLFDDVSQRVIRVRPRLVENLHLDVGLEDAVTHVAAVLRPLPLLPPPARPLWYANAPEGVEERLDGVGNAGEVHAEHVQHAVQGLHDLFALVSVKAGVVDLVIVIEEAPGKKKEWA